MSIGDEHDTDGPAVTPANLEGCRMEPLPQEELA